MLKSIKLIKYKGTLIVRLNQFYVLIKCFRKSGFCFHSKHRIIFSISMVVLEKSKTLFFSVRRHQQNYIKPLTFPFYYTKEYRQIVQAFALQADDNKEYT